MTPLYLWRCPKCGSHLEELTPIADRNRKPPRCPLCKCVMKRKPGDIAIRFKGKGWTSPGKLARKEE